MKLTQIVPGLHSKPFVAFRSNGDRHQVVFALSTELVEKLGVRAGGRASILVGADCIALDLAPKKDDARTYALVKDGSTGLAIHAARVLLPKIGSQTRRWLSPPVRGKRVTLKVPKETIAAWRKATKQ